MHHMLELQKRESLYKLKALKIIKYRKTKANLRTFINRKNNHETITMGTIVT